MYFYFYQACFLLMKVFLFFTLLFTSFALGDVSPQDYATLENFYNALGGSSWSDNTNWLTGDPCNDGWFGILCDGDNISLITLNNNNLVGTIPSDFSISILNTL